MTIINENKYIASNYVRLLIWKNVSLIWLLHENIDCPIICTRAALLC